MRGGCRDARRRRAAGPLLLAALLLAPSAGAAPTQSGDPQKQLQELQRELEKGQGRKGELDARAEELERELADIRGRLVAAADEARAQDEALARVEEAEAALMRDEGERLARIDADRAALTELLGALQRLSRLPPEALIAKPEPPSETLKSALLLRAAIPELKARADALSAQLAGLAEVRSGLAARRQEALAARAELERRQAELKTLAERREALSRATEAERQKVAANLGQLAARAEDLKGLLDRLEAEKKAAAEREKAAEAARRAKAEADRQAQAREKVAALGKAPGKKDLGGMVMPVRGQVAVRYGEPDKLGATSRGVTFAVRKGAPVVAPFDGSVMFAGPFKGYGLILIVEHANGYHSLIAGLGRIDTEVGQQVLTGEPVGAMASDGEPSLYFELRRGGQPINPLRGLTATDGKGQG
ncbi:MAG TPA: peptidoglycan DD-metalloendopeptidase family protein [Azospirillaceae bacterium]|nr:peptidoglycan DD-metalloendopeptidase family protein [Azospirillaceae bacterium]